jgi:hypothetical protein
MAGLAGAVFKEAVVACQRVFTNGVTLEGIALSMAGREVCHELVMKFIMRCRRDVCHEMVS